MVIQTQDNKKTGTGDAASTSFSFSGIILHASTDLEVTHVSAAGVETVLSEGTGAANYAVVVSSYPGTGTVTYPADAVTPMAADGEKIVMRLLPTIEQQTDLDPQGGYFADTQETQFDKLVNIDLSQQEQIDRAPKMKVSDASGADLTLPAPVANKVPAIWNAAADGFDIGPTANAITNAQTYSEAAAASLAAIPSDKYTFDDATSMADPGTGDFRLNNATVASVTQIAISALTAATGNPDVSAFIATWDDSTNTALRGTLVLRKSGTPATFAVFSVTGAVTDNGTWLQIPVTHVASSGSWTAADAAYLGFARAGDKGASGVGSGDLVSTNNLSDVANVTTARTNLGAGTGTMDNLVDDTTPQLGGFLDPNGSFIGMDKGGDLITASPLVIDTDGDYFDVTGGGAISSMTVAVNRHFFLQFDGAITLSHHATNLDLPGEADITVAPGDVAEFFSHTANQVQCVNYTRADGTALVATAFPAPGFTSSEQTVTVDTVLDVAHSLGAVPTLVDVVLRCKTTEAGYAVGDEISFSSAQRSASADVGVEVSRDATNVTIIQGGAINILSQSTLNAVALTPANWKWIIRAWV